MMIRLRKAKLEEVPAVRELAIEVYNDTFAEHNTPENLEAFFKDSYDLEKFNKEFSEPGSALYVALDDLKIIGFLRLRKSNEVDAYLGTNHLELQRLYIHRDYHGSAVSKMFMEEALAYAKKESSNGYGWGCGKRISERSGFIPNGALRGSVNMYFKWETILKSTG